MLLLGCFWNRLQRYKKVLTPANIITKIVYLFHMVTLTTSRSIRWICIMWWLLRRWRVNTGEDDAAVVPMFGKIAAPFVQCLVTPTTCNNGRMESKSVKYFGYHELAYLHPNHFTPDPEVVRSYGIPVHLPPLSLFPKYQINLQLIHKRNKLLPLPTPSLFPNLLILLLILHKRNKLNRTSSSASRRSMHIMTVESKGSIPR